MIRNVLFRVDSSAKLGGGHLMRCLALAEYLKDAGVTCFFACRDLPGNMCATTLEGKVAYQLLPAPANSIAFQTQDYRTWAECSPEWDAHNSTELLQQQFQQGHFDWVVVDHYAWQASEHQIISNLAKRIAVIDDLCNRPIFADIIIDSGEHGANDYQPYCPENTHLLLGRKYLPIAQKFTHLRAQMIKNRQFTVLISCGATDPDNYTKRMLESLLGLDCLPEIKIMCALADNAPYRNEVQQLCDQTNNAVLEVNADMALLASGASMALGSAGSGAFERSLMGCPNGIFMAGGDQANNYHALICGGAAISIADSADGTGISKSRVQSLVTQWFREFKIDQSNYHSTKQRAFEFIDGLGASRICDAMSVLQCREFTGGMAGGMV